MFKDPMILVAKLISGGQTGADRGGLEAALDLGIAHGGWCPKGRMSEDGTVPECFLLQETLSDKYPARTAANVREADATLVMSMGGIFDRGTGLTLKLIERMQKPYIRLNLRSMFRNEQIKRVREWLEELVIKLGRPAVINIAGPRESRVPGLQAAVKALLIDVLKA